MGAHIEKPYQKAVPEFRCIVKATPAEQGAHAKQMCQKGMRAPEVLRHEEREDVQAEPHQTWTKSKWRFSEACKHPKK